jgi:hypothetical protein
MSDFSFVGSCILTLSGIKKHDLEQHENIFDAQSIARIIEFDNIPIQQTIYRANPSVFTDLSTWPSNSNCRCWSCTRYFDGRPWICPTDTKTNAKKRVIICGYGNFCRAGCVQRWIETYHRTDGTFYDKTQFLRIYYKMMTGYDIVRIVPTMQHTELQEYCGSGGMSLEQFVDNANALSLEYSSGRQSYQMSSLSKSGQ